MSAANNGNVRQSELDKFGALASRWWGDDLCLCAAAARVRGSERLRKDVQAGAQHHGRFKARLGV